MSKNEWQILMSIAEDVRSSKAAGRGLLYWKLGEGEWLQGGVGRVCGHLLWPA